MPPECPTCVARPAGAAPRPAIKTPHERAPQLDEVIETLTEVLPPGISWDQRGSPPLRGTAGLKLTSSWTRDGCSVSSFEQRG
jgi:hypothetical protein